ncbi:HepT-like ribonuclease domain-containing protein [Amycolatopsis regifaucium]|uniref:HepT-like ribonuclease domain-containing protein n=1 Tax=Amycolatopsis regifaucium TaxID=546365 RepID=UPI001FD2623A|nr:HepT-like ribonuclease domain-containing protein [Amycolatopsis regifaucium]
MTSGIRSGTIRNRRWRSCTSRSNSRSARSSTCARHTQCAARIVAFRNILIHGCATVDDALVWQVLTERLPGLIGVLRRLQDA